MMRKAFTLIEIMIVMAIVTILSVVAIPQFMAYRQTVQERTCKAAMARIARGAEAYLARTGEYPSSIEDLASGRSPYFKNVPRCEYCDQPYELDSTSGLKVECKGHDASKHNVNGAE